MPYADLPVGKCQGESAIPPTTAHTDGPDTRTAILDVAERLVQSRGFNGFSYADVAAELGVTTAALHYHYRGKAELGEALITRYAARFMTALEAIAAGRATPAGQLRAYADLYLGTLRDERMCLCGMLAAEYTTLPEAMRGAIVAFFDDNHRWLAALLESSRAAGEVAFTGSADEAAQMIVGSLEGAMLVARPYADAARFQAVADRVIEHFTVPARPRRIS